MATKKKKNHGLPEELEDGYKLHVRTYKDFEEDGYTADEVDSWYEAHGDIVAIYSYETDDGDEGARVGVEFKDGRLGIYGCHADIESCTEEQFVEELTDSYYNS
ncbi:MAG: hypothetical protein NC218_02000 [Acetobacter sp.]|nr:hypothetical protein [Acetobacter sp.]